MREGGKAPAADRIDGPDVPSDFSEGYPIAFPRPSCVILSKVLSSTTFTRLTNALNNAIMSVFNASRLLGKTVIVTGASSGIGAVRSLIKPKVIGLDYLSL